MTPNDELQAAAKADPIVDPTDPPARQEKSRRIGKVLVGFLIGLGVVAFALYALILWTAAASSGQVN
jgi:hypothetical protein